MATILAGKVAVITGGGNGIGRASALRFLDAGACVVIADVNTESAGETLALAEAAGHGDRACVVRTDVTVEADVVRAIAAAVETFGRLDCVFNNAGVAGAIGPVTHLRVEDFDFTMAVLVRGVFLGMKHGARALKRQGGGVILSTASVAGLSGGEAPQIYSAAKAAVINLTRAVAVELAADRIRVNAICPGGINTPLLHRGDPQGMGALLDRAQPWPEHGRPDDIAAAAVYLASDDARFVTGAALVVDGGLTAAGGNLLRSQLGGDTSPVFQVVGVDRGSTGEEATLEPVE